MAKSKPNLQKRPRVLGARPKVMTTNHFLKEIYGKYVHHLPVLRTPLLDALPKED